MTIQGSRAVQVVLGEGEPGILRFVLEAEGFQVIGQARGEAELRHVLDATHPSVIVLDAGISASAAIDARARARDAQLVVVWPGGVRAGIADDRVDPATALHDLGAAVRRAAERMRPSDEDLIVTLPESPGIQPVDRDERPLLLVQDIGDQPTPRIRRRAGRILAVAAAWTLALTASAALGLTVPRTLGWFDRDPAPPVPIVPSPRRESQDAQGSLGDDGSDANRPTTTCDRPEGENGRAGGTGRPDDPGRGCGQGRGDAKGRPDDPSDRGNGSGSGNEGDRPEGPGNGGGKGNGEDRDAGGNDPEGGVRENGGDGGSKGPSKSSDASENEVGAGIGRAIGPG